MHGPDKQEPLDVALFEPWYGGSHRAFADTYRARSGNRVRIFGLPPRHWSWRQEASAWELARSAREAPPPDVVVVTDYVDLPRFLGFLPEAWRALPTVAYFHENQLTYPRDEDAAGAPQTHDRRAGFSNVLTAIRADALIFNSAFHRGDFARAAGTLLAALPRPNPRAELEEALARAHVVPPLPDLGCVPLGPGAPDGAPLRVLFPHRLEHDKDPVGFLHALEEAGRERPVEAVLTGGDPASSRPAVRDALERAGARVLSVGRIEERAAYLERIGTCDAVASTAHHEFFGIAVAEALASGAAPLLPDRLAYPELLEGRRATEGGFGLVDDLAAALAAADVGIARDPEHRRALRALALRHDAAGPRGARLLDRIVREAAR
ncbi:MAG: DUF3524 domain-containing protein [Planctomycetota bacterium]